MRGSTSKSVTSPLVVVAGMAMLLDPCDRLSGPPPALRGSLIIVPTIGRSQEGHDRRGRTAVPGRSVPLLGKRGPVTATIANAGPGSLTRPIELLVESQERYRTFKLDWHGGERFRVLVLLA